MQKFLAVFDAHWGYDQRPGREKAPLHDKKALQIVLDFAKDWKPDVVILGGDMLDCGPVSHHLKGKHRSLEGLRLLRDATELRQHVLAPLEALKPSRLVYLIGNHECHDAETELLTRAGWKHYDEITETDEALTVNPETRLAEYLPIERLVVREYEGPMVCLDNARMSLCVTPGHRLWTRTRGTSTNWQFAPAETTLLKGPASRLLFPTTIALAANDLADISDTEIALTAWFLADGWYDSNRYPHFAQRASTKHQITDLLDTAGWAYRCVNRGRRTTHILGKRLKSSEEQWEIHLPVGPGTTRLRELVTDKKALPSWVYLLSARQSAIFIEHFIAGDGSVHINAPTARMIYTSNAAWASDLQRVAVHAGLRTSISEPRPGEYRINLTARAMTHFVGAATTKHYKGVVWCISTKNQTMVTRRRTKIIVTGNCWIDGILEETPGLEGIVSVDSLLKLTERDWQIVPQGGHLKLGKLYFMHGDTIKGNANVTKRALDIYDRPIRFGHFHTLAATTKHSPLDVNQPKTAIAVPCLCKRSPSFLHGAPNRWVSGFLYGTVLPDGGFSDQVAVIVKNRWVSPSGKLYRA